MNPYRDDLVIELAGRGVKLRPTFEALAEMEGALGFGVVELCAKFSRGQITLKQLVAVVAAGIRGAGGTVPDDLGQLVLRAGMVTVMQAASRWLVGALSGDSPDEEDGDEKKA